MISPLVLAASASGVLIFAQRPLSVLSFTGPDRHRFLHGLCTADVNALRGAGVAESAVVDAAGNTQDLLTVLDGGGDELLALGEPGRGSELHAFFDRYLFPADAVSVAEASGEYSCYEVVGEAAGSLLADALGSELPHPLPANGEVRRLDGSAAWLLGSGALAAAAPAAAQEGERSFSVLLKDEPRLAGRCACGGACLAVARSLLPPGPR
ncbi:hypothetical protein EMIHUDRAFT_227868 [Emiliania huxleyi CCMP1516]|uniref:Aminomethyltransferase folate-binding domain-containing protein n=2 Tax=Emiliania huxleyi TaxID=2903 RepID=A0A0D3KH63_EMIH1|nr:hypothetical protein EMIHUDRAFT_227868 [Emiliania huxleyi CCMP1516]EOD35098.1 hypothetical protein EMIHUDRAFT_227868 [Emiliania huxleyi CCMP1516]|eukprot:XP_005787527.1 hypothetical protein EMIHUDRAFT_227868 [Emiliania huxleyi CCMP1516]